jgi:glucose/mannose transport system substrate-binding protein
VGLGNATIIAGVDQFAFPKVSEPTALAAQKILSTAILGPQVQLDFNKIKGSVPARIDPDPIKLAACSQVSYKLLGNPENVVLSPYTYFTAQMRGEVRDVVASAWSNLSASVDDVISVFDGAMGNNL